ncbi:MAG: DUF2061 domain-containing protein [Dehalococcoidales bacterium]|nr:DUF2061 domain-containing protein [Dehalococcoidales bacterium]
MDSHKRSILKAFTWRVIASVITFLVSYALTRKVELAAGISLFDTLIKVFSYYGHERIWEKINFGRKATPSQDYTI